MSHDLPLTLDLTTPNGKHYVQPTGLFINNEFTKSSDGEKFATIDPATEKEIAHVYAASAQDVDTAVRAARAALQNPSWRDLSASARGDLMYKLSQLAEEHADCLASIESWNNGKAISQAKVVDVSNVVAVLKYYAGYADKIHGQVIDSSDGRLAYTTREPVGVCGQIIPWNYPLLMAAWKLGPALACGNTVILKAAESTPLSILYFATLIKEAGFPPGVVNILNGFGHIAGSALAAHTDVDKIAFTGSTSTGRQIMKLAASNLKSITLETGGKSPLVVFADAELDQAVKMARLGIMSNQGQVCTATSRILVQETIYDEFCKRFIEHIREATRVGDPFADVTYQGPQISKAQFDRIISYIDSARDQGANLATGGQPIKDIGDGKGFFLAPTVFTNVTSSMKVFREEIFGPFAVVTLFKTEEEAIQLANDSIYGLHAAVFTQDISKALRFARRVESGMVGVNTASASDFRTPFGGVKQSGIGRELGEAGLAAYSTIKAITINASLKL